MLHQRLFAALALGLLASCETTDMPEHQRPSMIAATREADAAIKAGRPEQALQTLKQAAQAFPAGKTAWLRMAQLHFDRGHYGEAIINAQAVLARDADDMVAHSIVAVSGLRVASKALADLTEKNKLNGDLRGEAQGLARLLRNTLGEEVLVPGPSRSAARAPKRSEPAKPLPVKPSGSTDPFANLK